MNTRSGAERVLNVEEGLGGAVSCLGKDGEIKGPGPFGSTALMVLKNFRDLRQGLGPGFLPFPRLFIDLSGTFGSGGRNV